MYGATAFDFRGGAWVVSEILSTREPRWLIPLNSVDAFAYWIWLLCFDMWNGLLSPPRWCGGAKWILESQANGVRLEAR